MAPAVGFEPTTNRLTADRSTTELRWSSRRRAEEIRGSAAVVIRVYWWRFRTRTSRANLPIFTKKCSVLRDGKPAARNVIAEREREQNAEPEQACAGGEMEHFSAPANVHEKKRNERGLGQRDEHGEHEIERAEVEISSADREQQQHDQRAEVFKINTGRKNFVAQQRAPAREERGNKKTQ